MIRPVIKSVIKSVIKPVIYNVAGKQLASSNWTPLILVVEDASPTHVVMTFSSAKTVDASDFTIAGFTVSSGSWSGNVYTLVLSTDVVFGDSLTVVYSGKSYYVTNNVGILLPQKLIVSPDIAVAELETSFGTNWKANTGTLVLNSTEYFSGSGSGKATSAVSTITDIVLKNQTFNFSADSGKSLRFRIYPHTNPVTTMQSIMVRAFTDTSNYYQCEFTPFYLIQNQWNLMICPGYTGWSTSGAPNWNNITRIGFVVSTVNGQSQEASFDYITEGFVPKNSILITLDDAYASNYTKAYPLLKAKGFVATHYTPHAVVGSANRMTTSMLAELNANLHDIANHTDTHADLSLLSQAQVETELNNCKAYLDGLGLTRASDHVAYPGGKWNATVLAAMAASSMKTGRTTNNGVGGVGYSTYDNLWPYKIGMINIANTTTLAAVLASIDEMIDLRLTPVLLLHELVDSDANAATQWLTSQFSDLVDGIETRALQSLSISEYERLYSGAITVHHK